MLSVPITVIVVVILALAFDFINGFHDTANAIANSVSTRSLTPRQALMIAAVFNFVGALVSTKVAGTIGKGIVAPSVVTEHVVISALIGAIVWNLITWYFGIPSSSSHAIIGGLLGATIASSSGGGFSLVNWTGFFEKIMLPLVCSPILGFVVGFTVMILLMWVFRGFTPRKVNSFARVLQIMSAMFMSYSHGSNDAQKSMGIITMALVSSGLLPVFAVPTWVKLACAIAMALGTSIGGWRIIKTMGVKMISLERIQGFAADTSASMIIGVATHFGAPVSTTHVMSSAIMGVGASKRLSAVRWGIARNILWAWVLTIPISAFMGAVMILIIGR